MFKIWLKSSFFLLRFSIHFSAPVSRPTDFWWLPDCWKRIHVRFSSYLLEKLLERSTQDYCCFSSFYSFVQLSRRESRCTLWPLGGYESSRLFKGCFLSSSYRTGANFPSGRRNRCMNRVDYNYSAESISWILSTKLLEQQTCCSFSRDYKCKRLFPSHDLLDIYYTETTTAYCATV